MGLSYKLMDSPVGKLKLVASEKGLVAVLWQNDAPERVPLKEMTEDPKQKVLVETERQLRSTSRRSGGRLSFLWICEGRNSRRTCGRSCWRFRLARLGAMGNWRRSWAILQQVGRWELRMGEIRSRLWCLAIA